MAFDPSTGTPLALMDATYITATRTAAGSALATRLLAREDARVLAILGTGVQARSHARAIPRVMAGLDEVRVAGRTSERVEAFAEELRAQGLPAAPAASFEQAQAGAEVVCATTHTVDPVVRRTWLRDGVHVNSVGFNVAGREVDADTVANTPRVIASAASSVLLQRASATPVSAGNAQAIAFTSAAATSE